MFVELDSPQEVACCFHKTRSSTFFPFSPSPLILSSCIAIIAITIGSPQAKSDCDASLKLSLNPKALLRRGTARLGLNDLHGARKDFAHVLALEPNNRQAREELASLEDMEATYGLAAT